MLFQVINSETPYTYNTGLIYIYAYTADQKLCIQELKH